MKWVADGDVRLQLARALDGGLTLGDNLDGGFLEITTTGSQQTVQHGLGRVPIGWLVLLTDAQVDVWAKQLSSWTNELLYLQASAASVTVRLFVL